MPTYDYVCDACGHRFEEFQSITAAAHRKCPECGRHKLRRLIGTGAGILFKGPGFYETDYRSDAYKKAAEADSKGSGKGGGRDSGKDGGKQAEPKSDSGAATSPAPSPDEDGS